MVIQTQLAIETVCNNQAWQSVETILVQPVGGGCVNKVVWWARVFIPKSAEEQLRVYKLFHAPQRYKSGTCLTICTNINLFVLQDG